MSKDLGVNKSVVPTSIYSYSGFGFGSGWVVQSIHSKYTQDKLPTVSGMYTSESGTRYTNGQIVCVIQGIREFVPNSAPVTTHEEFVCMDIK